MLYQSREKIKRLLFNFLCKGILSTAPIQTHIGSLKIVSMVSHLDIVMYLISIKSLYYYIKFGDIIVVNDGTLTSTDKSLLKHHLCPILIIDIDHIETGHCPKGGTWERLLVISDYVKRDYVIQLDSDCITVNNIPEVLSCIETNQSFILGTNMGRQVSSMTDVCKQMKKFISNHVQVVAEQNFDRLHKYEQLKYARGCSGFAGFAKGSFSRMQVEEFSKEMTNVIGQTWRQWGSEQVTSNVILSNSPKSAVLPYPQYANFSPDIPYKQSSFLHFIGTHRFKNGTYVRTAKQVGKKLKQAKSQSW